MPRTLSYTIHRWHTHMFGLFKRKDDSKRFVATTNEVASFIQTLDESGRARLLLCAQEFRHQIAPDSPQIDEMLLRPADFSTADCSAIYRPDGTYARYGYFAVTADCCTNGRERNYR